MEQESKILYGCVAALMLFWALPLIGWGLVYLTIFLISH